MMNLDTNVKISIIIPAYNANETICTTLDSIKRQKINVNFETILVNDCSSYNYESFIKEYKKYFNIREIATPSNMGPGGARQWGIDHSNSKYIVFIDSDDYFYQDDSLQKMYNKISSFGGDLVIGNFLYERDNKVVVKKHNLVWLHGKIYKREFLDKYKIRFNETRANEDNGFNRLIILMDPKATYLDEIVYVYKENPSSITRCNNRLYKISGLEGYCYNMNWAMDEALKRGIDDKLVFSLAQNVLGSLYFYYLDLEDKFDVSKILVWSKTIKEKYEKYMDKDILNNLNLQHIKENLKDDISLKEERISFGEFLEMIN